MAVRQIKSGIVTEEALAALNTISDESHRLAALASSALDMFVKKAADEKKAPVDVGKMVSQLIGILGPTATKRGVKIRTNIPQYLPYVWAISGELTRVFWNILENSIKYTPGGDISISAMSAADDVIISISDTGCGMTSENVAHAFERGYGDGSGLGLVFCKEIIEAHRGEISIDSEYGVGTSVTFSMPKAREGK
jgi:signal transduction histidine kinase